jgi:signal transduction histidine kinase
MMRPCLRLESSDAHSLFPVSEVAAARIIEFLASRYADKGRVLISQALCEDPYFLVWSVCRMDQNSQDPPQCIDDVVAWFQGYLLNALDWQDRDHDVQSPEDDSVIGELVFLSVATALIAFHSEVAGARGHESEIFKSRCFFLALLHKAPEIVSTASQPTNGASPLPNWLADTIEDLKRETRNNDHLETIVREAIRTLGTLSTKGASRVATVSSAIDQATEIRHQWTSGRTKENRGTNFTSRLLSTLQKRLVRLSQLENDFDRQIQTAKLNSLRELAYGASHEVNNPLANISTRAQTLLRDESDPERRRKLATINSQALRAHEMIAEMMLFAKPPRLDCRPTNLFRLIERVAAELTSLASQQSTEIVVSAGSASNKDMIISCDENHLSEVIRALCQNSLDALVSGGWIELSLAADPKPACDGTNWVSIGVADNGPGIPAEIIGQLFDPFFSGREAGRGLGLGLSKCWRIVTEHEGIIEVDSQTRRGTTFTIRLRMTVDSGAVENGEKASPANSV